MAMDVLITRPLAQARATAQRLEKLGFCPHIVPLVEIVPLDYVVPSGNFDAILATSANAFEPVENALQRLRHLPIFCVGESTKIAAQDAGFLTIAAVGATATQLVAELEFYAPRHFLYLAGKVRRPILEQGLTGQGHKLTVLETYHQRPISFKFSELVSLPRRFDCALFYSATAARQAHYLARFFDEQTRLLCLSSRIADALPPPLRPYAHIAHHPTKTSLLSLLP